MDLSFENDYQKKVLLQTFKSPTELSEKLDVLKWRSLWLSELKNWHSPYKSIIDCTNLKVSQDPLIQTELQTMLKFFHGFFLKRAVGYGFKDGAGHELLPFKVESDRDTAFDAMGIRSASLPREKTDFRSQIQIQNHFNQHCVEITFSEKVRIDDEQLLTIFRSKITNNLMQWHSKWNLLIDCSNLSFDLELSPAFDKMIKFFRGLHLKNLIGYSPSENKTNYPFPVYRARHRAVALLETEGAFSGNDADCNSRKPKK